MIVSDFEGCFMNFKLFLSSSVDTPHDWSGTKSFLLIILVMGTNHAVVMTAK